MPNDGPPDDPIRDAAYNAAAIATLAWHQETAALAHVLDRAHRHGLTVADLCHATGLDEPFVARLLAEAC